jgi:ABC-type protease/lipase transport system fused ATPase/permease subunit
MSTSPQIPSVEVRYNDLRFSVKTSTTSASAAIPNVGTTLVNVATFPFKALGKLVLPKSKAALTSESSTSKNFTVLGGVSGVLRPGTLTLLIAPPGHGKSALMKALTQLLPPKELSGTVTYSGVSAQEAPGMGIHIGSLAQYVQQV